MSQYLPVELKETPAFGPFMGQFIALALIAGWTSQNNVRNVVCRDICTDSATKRVGMFYVIDVLAIDFSKFSKATSSIIATVFLPLQLLLNLLCCVRALNLFFHRCSVATMDAISRFYIFTLVVFFAVCEFSGLYFGIIAISLVAFLLTGLYIGLATVYFAIILVSFLNLRSGIVNFSVRFVSFLDVRMAEIFQLICALSFLINRQFSGLLMLGIATISALICQSIWPVLIVVEKRKSGRVPFLAFRALLLGRVFGYSVHAIRLQSLSSCQRMLVASLWRNIFPNYTTNQPSKQHEEVFAWAK